MNYDLQENLKEFISIPFGTLKITVYILSGGMIKQGSIDDKPSFSCNQPKMSDTVSELTMFGR